MESAIKKIGVTLNQDQIQAKVGQEVTPAEMVEMIKSNPIGTSPGDVRVRSGVLRFSFGPDGVKLLDAEERTPLKPTV